MGTNLLMMGPPGAGKGTQATLLAQELGLKHLATGDILRGEVAAESAIGKRVKGYLDAGALVPDEVMGELVGEHVIRAAKAGGFVLDGYPRTIGQAVALENLLKDHDVTLSAVLNLQVPDVVIVQRLANRQTCPVDQRTYHRINNPPRVEGVCDACQTPLVIRRDDTEKVIRNRLKVYWDQTAPLVDHYRGPRLLRTVDASLPINLLCEAIRNIVNTVCKVPVARTTRKEMALQQAATSVSASEAGKGDERR